MQQGRRWLPIAALLCAALGGCTLSDSKKHDDVWSVWSRSDKSVAIKVTFATDRALSPQAELGVGWHWGSAMACGSSTISSFAPAAATPSAFFPCQGAEVAEGRQSGGSAFAMSGFAAEVQSAARARGCDRMLLYVHGYNTTFRTALLHSGQIAADTAWSCAAALFSWSSEGQVDRYAADIERSSYAVPALINLLRAVADRNVRENVLAHSMGARITLTALGALRSYCESHDRRIVQELILVAPDISAEHDNDDFGQLLNRARACVARVTIYASDNDMILIASEGFHGGIPRAGRMPKPDLQYPACDALNADVIDASLAPGDDLGHGYFINSYEMMGDIRWVLAGKPLSARIAVRPPTLTRLEDVPVSCGDAAERAVPRYVLAVDASRRPSWGRRLLRHVVPLVMPVQ